MTTMILSRYQSTGFPLELEFGAGVGDTFKGLEMDGNAAALSILFKVGKFIIILLVRKIMLGRRMAQWYWNQ